ncbi:MAG: sigma-70 family RNA polymerase sigma factor [Actinobacteria bacterium]|nr:MAG: sigma-70 family RNA polymerase sigma factor [Actinomycetota bacterium]
MSSVVSTTLLRTQSDARLSTLAAKGQERAFEAIVERYRKVLHRCCRRVLPEARAEDAVQQTFLNAWTALQAGTDVQDLRAWLYRIARNVALDSARKAGYDYDELTDSLRLAHGVDVDLERRAVIRETLTGVAALPANQREALLRTAVDGHSRAAIARDLDVSEGAVRQLVHRARTTLRAAATVVTPLPFASWAAAMGGAPDAPAVTQRIAELAGGAGSAGGAGVLLKAGTAFVAAGALAVGPPGTALRNAVRPASAAGTPAGGGGGASTGDAGAGDRQGEDAGGRGHGYGREGAQGDGPRGHGPASARPDRAGEHGAGLTIGTDLGGMSGESDGGSGSSGGSGSHDALTSGSGTSGSHDGGSGTSGSGTSGGGSGTSGSSDGGSTTTSTLSTTTTSSSDGGHDGAMTTTSGPLTTTTTTTTTSSDGHH